MNAAAKLSPEHIESIIRNARIYPEYATGRVACPHCGAAKGELCISSITPPLHVHRVEAAKDAMRKELAEDMV